MAHWNDEVERASRELRASLDELRNKTDKYITVSALATTLFAVLTPGGSTNGSGASPQVVTDDETQPWTPTPTLESSMAPTLVSAGPTNGAPYPDADRVGVVRLGGSADSSRLREPAMCRTISSPNGVIATVGTPLSFTVTTTGTPVPTITSKGSLPTGLTLVNNHDGSATLGGTPGKSGVYRTTIKAKFGKDADRYVVTQAFAVTVTRRVG